MSGACFAGASVTCNTKRGYSVMDKKIFNVVKPREGDGKTYWDKHGVLIVKDGRISLHLASIPTGEWDGWLHVYPREEQDPQGQKRGNGQARRFNGGGNGQGQPQQQASPDFDDDIPF